MPETTPECPKIVGSWRRITDGLIISFDQIGCAIYSGADFFLDPQITHSLQGGYDPDTRKFNFTVMRTDHGNGCVVELYGYVRTVTPSRLEWAIKGSNGSCSFSKTYSEATFLEKTR
jgi:hypothetical protein